mmetsp:Transcript_7613/g.14333  ORF Transcript_7613/g.14333 Transcript_7613/m.14333 type:complete len:235 (-) Transcript_7613:32-736(-)
MLRRFFADFSKLDPKQFATFSDTLLLTNALDEVVGTQDKLTCHSWPYLSSPQATPHRAYSIFLFNSQNQLLLQQRSHKKVTWPLAWSNTCCSHPMADAALDEMKTELIERVKFELGFNLHKIFKSLGDLKLVSRILYRSKYDEQWGEYELDYIFFAKQAKLEYEAQIPANTEEVNSVKWASQDEITKMINAKQLVFTPWFKAIVDMPEFKEAWSSLDTLKEVTKPHIVNLGDRN